MTGLITTTQKHSPLHGGCHSHTDISPKNKKSKAKVILAICTCVLEGTYFTFFILKRDVRNYIGPSSLISSQYIVPHCTHVPFLYK